MQPKVQCGPSGLARPGGRGRFWTPGRRSGGGNALKSSERQAPLPDGPAAEPVQAVALSRTTDAPPPVRTPAPAMAASMAGNAAVQRLATGSAPRAAGPGLLAAGGNQALRRWHTGVQPKLTISQPGDRFEAQADAVAARLDSGADPGGPAPAVSRLAAPSAAAGEPSAPPGLEALLADPGPGAPIPPDVLARIEQLLGPGLGDVQVHSHGAAQAAAAQLGARAFTSGPHIFLGAGESATDLPLMAHEATHVVQQQPVGVFRLQRSSDSILPDFLLDPIRDLARSVPGYDMLTVVAGYDPIANRNVDRSPENLVRGVLGLVPFGNVVAGKLLELGVLQDAFRMIDAGLTANNLTLDRFQREVDQAWAEFEVSKGIDGNVDVITRHVDGIYRDALSFVRGILEAIVQLIRDAAVGLAETYLVGTPVWDLTKKVLHHDPLRGTPVTAPTVEILADFLRLIGKDQALAQMQERGTLQKTADWLDLRVPEFLSLIGELVALFEAGWDAIQPENLANLSDNLGKLARDAVALVQRVGAFASEVVATVLRLIKDALLDWLSREAAEMRGFRLMTVMLGQDPFTGRTVARTAENLIGGFIALLPGGEATYQKLAEAGVIADAAAQIEGAMARLGISLDLIVNTFLGVWNSLTLEDLLNPIGAFLRVLDKFGEPLGRIVAFAAEVLKVVITLILKLMNFPSELVGSIISNAMAAIDDIQRDPVAFFVNMLQALKTGFGNFFDKVLGYLMGGLADWLFRGLGAMGIQKPPDLSFRSILELVLQVLDITADKLWAKLGKHVGEDVVQKIRSGIGMAGEAFDFVKDVQENGIGAIWKHIENQLGNLWDTLLGMAKDWIVTTIIEKAVAKVLSMLDPTGIMAVVNSAIAFFNAVQSVIEYVREILAIVNDYVGTLAAVAAGNIAAGAAKIEKGLAGAVPVAIGFLANQAGLGNVPEKLMEIIEGIRELVDKALEWLFEQAMRLGKAALNALGGGGADPEQAPEDQKAPPGSTDPLRPTVVVPFDMAGEGHELTFHPAGDDLEITMASGRELPLTTKFRQAHVAIDNFRHYMETEVEDPDVLALYQAEIAPKLATFPTTEVAKFKAIYDGYFPKNSPPLSKEGEKAAAKDVGPLVKSAQDLLAEIKAWAAQTGIPDLAEGKIANTLQNLGNEVWKKAHEAVKARIRAVLAGYDYHGAPIDFVGSVQTGWRGPHKGTTHFDASDFDVDCYVVLPDEFDAVVERSRNRRNPIDQNGKIFPGPETPELAAKSRELAAALHKEFPKVAKIATSNIVLRRSPP